MIWVLLLLAAGAVAYFLLVPRRLPSLENVSDVEDKDFRAQGIVKATEDPQEVRHIAVQAAQSSGERPAQGQGDSLTTDWLNQPQEQHGETEGPTTMAPH